ncbi:helix-turn-helix transcriptional regulator [Galactobacter valiniphilus]|nr:helix-turn-helix domain-containing protein [Galactobacter valiniphilus]
MTSCTRTIKTVADDRDLQLLTLTDVARLVGRSRSWLYRAIEWEPIATTYAGPGRTLYRRRDVEAWLDTLTEKSARW